MPSTLSPLQQSALRAIAGVSGWRLTGGAALAGYHLGHRTTQDLDLFLSGVERFDAQPAEILDRLAAAGLRVRPIQRTPGFERHVVELDGERLTVDLVADPVPCIEPPTSQPPGILVDTPQEILTNKLTTLLSRAEVRDLVDVKALVEAGSDLDRALSDAPRKDGGFSPMTLAWVLGQFPTRAAASLGFDANALTRFRDLLIDRLID